MYSSGLLGGIVDTKIVISGKNVRIYAFLYRSTCFSIVEVLACFWTVPGQSGAGLPIFIYPFDEP